MKNRTFPEWCDEAYDELLEGRLVWINGKCFGVCAKCVSIICLNKRFFGSAHLCM